jgi:hypothetical protein
MNQLEQVIAAIIQVKLIVIEKKVKSHLNRTAKMRMSNELTEVLVQVPKMANLIQTKVT